MLGVQLRWRFRNPVDPGWEQVGHFIITQVENGLHVLTGLLGAWLYKKYGRKIRLEFNDLKVKATSVEEIERLLRVAEEQIRGLLWHALISTVQSRLP